MSTSVPTHGYDKCETNRGQEWIRFSRKILDHIENYTVPQYGDMPDDLASQFDARDIIVNMRRYLNRADNNARGKQEALRDCLKLAHYACMLYSELVVTYEEKE